MVDRESTLRRYAQIWNGSANVDELDQLVTSNYLGHIASRDRNLRQLKADIVAGAARAQLVTARLE